MGKEPEKDNVKIYTLSTCSHCRKLKMFLDKCNIQFDFVDVDVLTGEERDTMVEEVKKLNPRCSFPTIQIGETVIVGFDEDRIREVLKIE